MFNKLKGLFGGENPELVILSPMTGVVKPLSEVSDPTFGEGILGKGVAIEPGGNRVLSPVTGTVSQMFDTGHAVSLLSDEGVEVLVHVGLDTIKLRGEHYTKHAGDGDKVKAGDLLIEFDREAIAAAGYDTVTPVVICNTGDFQEVSPMDGGSVRAMDEIIRIRK